MTKYFIMPLGSILYLPFVKESVVYGPFGTVWIENSLYLPYKSQGWGNLISSSIGEKEST